MAWILIELLAISSKVLGQWKERLCIGTTILAINTFVEITRDLALLTLLLDQKRIDAFDVEHVLVALIK